MDEVILPISLNPGHNGKGDSPYDGDVATPPRVLILVIMERVIPAKNFQLWQQRSLNPGHNGKGDSQMYKD